MDVVKGSGRLVRRVYLSKKFPNPHPKISELEIADLALRSMIKNLNLVPKIRIRIVLPILKKSKIPEIP